MKSLLFCTSYIKDHQTWQSRYQRWLDFYKDMPIDTVKNIMIDDGSPFLPPADVIGTLPHHHDLSQCGDRNVIVRFDENLGRQGLLAYPGWWRSFLHSMTIADDLGVDKIIHIESDAYVLSQRLVDFINETKTGWHALWTQRFQFPETAIQIICRDQFENLEKFKQHAPKYELSEFAEKLFPFTSVNRNFKGDRYSEIRKNRGIFRSRRFDSFPLFRSRFFHAPSPHDADFVTQCALHQTVRFRGGKS